MKNCLGPFLSKVFEVFDKVHEPYCYVRYADGTFACFPPRRETSKFFHCLNRLHHSLIFTMEEEKDNMTPFLDMLLETGPFSFVTNVYC